jgi:hypothetical protein
MHHYWAVNPHLSPARKMIAQGTQMSRSGNRRNSTNRRYMAETTVKIRSAQQRD